MQIRISEELNTILLYARDEAMRTGSYAIGADHLMLGILRHGENAACLLLQELGVDRPYSQIFTDRHGFIPNLSVMALLFNEGPASLDYLTQ